MGNLRQTCRRVFLAFCHYFQEHQKAPSARALWKLAVIPQEILLPTLRHLQRRGFLVLSGLAKQSPERSKYPSLPEDFAPVWPLEYGEANHDSTYLRTQRLERGVTLSMLSEEDLAIRSEVRQQKSLEQKRSLKKKQLFRKRYLDDYLSYELMPHFFLGSVARFFLEQVRSYPIQIDVPKVILHDPRTMGQRFVWEAIFRIAQDRTHDQVTLTGYRCRGVTIKQILDYLCVEESLEYLVLDLLEGLKKKDLLVLERDKTSNQMLFWVRPWFQITEQRQKPAFAFHPTRDACFSFVFIFEAFLKATKQEALSKRQIKAIVEIYEGRPITKSKLIYITQEMKRLDLLVGVPRKEAAPRGGRFIDDRPKKDFEKQIPTGFRVRQAKKEAAEFVKTHLQKIKEADQEQNKSKVSKAKQAEKGKGKKKAATTKKKDKIKHVFRMPRSAAKG